jgi:hypothetical protein
MDLAGRDGSGTSIFLAGWERESHIKDLAGRDGSGTDICGAGWERDENLVPRRALLPIQDFC